MHCFLGQWNRTALFCVMLSLTAGVGCRQEASRWEQAQSNSDGKSAQQSSTDRMNAPAGQPTVESDADQPPPFTPDQPSEPSGPVTWKPKGDATAADTAKEIDLDALTSGDPLPGSEFNKFFPEQSGVYDMVAKQEKQGFAEYSLRRGGEEIAQLSVTDLRSNPAAAEKFQTPDMMVEDFPAKNDGSKGTTLLVKQRFQVKVRSPGGQLNESDRVKWLKAFDLDGIAGLAN